MKIYFFFFALLLKESFDSWMIISSYDKILISILHLLNYLRVISIAFEYSTLTCKLYEVHCSVPISSVSTSLRGGVCVCKQAY